MRVGIALTWVWTLPFGVRADLEMEQDWELMSELEKDELIDKKIVCEL